MNYPLDHAMQVLQDETDRYEIMLHNYNHSHSPDIYDKKKIGDLMYNLQIARHILQKEQDKILGENQCLNTQ